MNRCGSVYHNVGHATGNSPAVKGHKNLCGSVFQTGEKRAPLIHLPSVLKAKGGIQEMQH